MNAKEIVSRLLSSEVKGDLLVLFHQNPGLIDTFEGVALRIGRRADNIENDVKDFLDLGLLRTRRIGGQRVLLLNRTKDKETQELLASHVRDTNTNPARTE